MVGGKVLVLRTPARVVDGGVLVPLECLKSLGAKFEAHGRKVNVTSASGKSFVYQATIVGRQPFFKAADMADELGAAAVWSDADRTLRFHSIIERVEYTGSELRISTSYPAVARVLDTSWTRKSNKLVLDIAGAQFPDDGANFKLINSSSANISTGTVDDGETARVVLELPQSANHQLASRGAGKGIRVSMNGLAATPSAPLAPTPPAPDAPPASSVTLPAVTVTGVTCQQISSRQVQIAVDASAPLTCSTSMCRKSNQMFLDFSHTGLQAPIADIAVDHQILDLVHMEQRDPNTVRMTLNLKRVAGFDAKWDDASGKFVITLELPKGAGGLLSQKIVVIDAGHGGSDTGAQGSSDCEKDCTLPMALEVERLLAKNGACVIMTRQTDTYVGLTERVDVAVRNSADFFVSIHCNSCQVPNSISGIETYYHGQDPNGRALAQCIHAAVVKASTLPDRRVRSDTVLYASGLAVLRGTSALGIPSTLVETGYINNFTDGSMLITPEYQQRIAGAIVEGLKEYVEGNGQRVADSKTAEQD
jgi:N-acetylmuramoyl-L-alanine amidase